MPFYGGQLVMLIKKITDKKIAMLVTYNDETIFSPFVTKITM